MSYDCIHNFSQFSPYNLDMVLYFLLSNHLFLKILLNLLLFTFSSIRWVFRNPLEHEVLNHMRYRILLHIDKQCQQIHPLCFHMLIHNHCPDTILLLQIDQQSFWSKTCRSGGFFLVLKALWKALVELIVYIPNLGTMSRPLRYLHLL